VNKHIKPLSTLFHDEVIKIKEVTKEIGTPTLAKKE
jgi:hypothetical protein